MLKNKSQIKKKFSFCPDNFYELKNVMNKVIKKKLKE